MRQHPIDRIHNTLIADKEVNVILPEKHDMPLAPNEIYIEMCCSECDWQPDPIVETSKTELNDIYDTLLPHMITMQKHSDKTKHETIMKCYTPSQSIVQTNIVPRPRVARFFTHSDGQPTVQSKILYWTLALSAIPVFTLSMLNGITAIDIIPTSYATFWAWSTYNRIRNFGEPILP